MTAWLFGSGFPKSHNVSMAIDREAGAEREVIGVAQGMGGENLNRAISSQTEAMRKMLADFGAYVHGREADHHRIPVTAPATEEGKEWERLGHCAQARYGANMRRQEASDRHGCEQCA